MYPLPANHRKGHGLHHLKADEINTIENMLNGLQLEVGTANQVAVEKTYPDQQGNGWKYTLPGAGSGLPSNANKSKWMVLTLSADNAMGNDNPALWIVDWVRAHA